MKLSFGMVGGGNGAFIGNVHRRGAIMDNLAVLTAGCFTRSMDKNRAAAEEWGVADPQRVYADFREMAERESARADGIDFVSIVTPTDTHYEIAKCFLEHGIHVVCDKPLCTKLDEALELKRIAQERGLLFGVTYTYAAYAVIRQAREMIDAGMLGPIVKIVAEYPQDWLIVSTVAEKSDQALWRLDPQRAGGTACCSDIGTHVEALISLMTGLRLEKVLARLNPYKGSPMDHDMDALLEYEGGIPGTLWASQIASGNDCGIKIRVYGEKGAIEWCHTSPMELRYTELNRPTQIFVANREYSLPACRSQCRLPAGHPEGYYEAFGNIYRGFCLHLLEKKGCGEPGDFRYPTLDDGIAGIRFVDACVRSSQQGGVWISL